MAWYDDWSAAVLAIGGVAATVIVGLANQLIKTRRELSKSSSEAKVERSDAGAKAWSNEWLMSQVERSEARHEAMIAATKTVYAQRETHIAEIAMLTERLTNCERERVECKDRAQRAETRATIAEERNMTQTEQILVMSLKIDSLTTALAKYDPAEAARLSPRAMQQPLLVPPLTDDEGSS